MPLPPPDNTKQLLLRVLIHFDRSTGVAGVLERVDWSAASLPQVVHLVLARPPASSAELDAPSPLALAGTLLCGPEFRWRIIRLLLDAFPGKRRLFHVHVPKAAGTHLRAALQRQHALIPANLAEPGQYGTDDFFERLATVLQRLRASDEILVSGHLPLRRILGQEDWTEPGTVAWWRAEPAPFRFGDRAFTVVRDPRDIVISHVNYVVTRVLDDPECKRADTRGWLRLLDLPQAPAAQDGAALRDLARRVLHNPFVTEGDRICRMLGAGTADSALETMALCHVEISDVDRYRAWMQARWGIESDRRSNMSRPFLVSDALAPRDQARVDELTGQDRILYKRIRHALDTRQALSVWGPDLRAAPAPEPKPAPPEPARWLIG